MMALPLVTLHLALPRLPLPRIAYHIHCFANTASAYKLRSTCIVPWLSPFCSMALKHGPPPSLMRCQRRLMRVFWLRQVSNHSIRERTKQPIASSLLRQRRLSWYGHLHRMPSSLPVRRVYDFIPNIHGWKRPIEAAPKLDGLIQSNTTSILLASTPPMLPRLSLTDLRGRPLLADCQRSNPSKALKSSKSSQDDVAVSSSGEARMRQCRHQ